MGYLDHTDVSIGLEHLQLLFLALLPQANVLIVVDDIDRIAYEPEVTLILLFT